MSLTLRGILLVAVLVWSIVSRFKYDDRILSRLVRAARGRVKRALLVVTVYHLAFIGVQGVFGIIAAIAYHANTDLPAVPISATVLLIGLTLTAPFVFPLCCRAYPVSLGTSFTSFAELREVGASKLVARAIAYPGAVLFYFLLAPVWFGVMAAVIYLE